MVDKEGELLNGEWCFEIHEDYETDSTKIKDKNNPKMAWWLRRLNMDYLKKQPKEFRFWRRIDGSCWKILASTDKSLGLPLLPVILAKAKKYTEEDILKKLDDFTDNAPISYIKSEFKKYFQSLNSPPKQVEVEIDFIPNMWSSVDVEDEHTDREGLWIPKVANNFVQVKRWIYAEAS